MICITYHTTSISYIQDISIAFELFYQNISYLHFAKIILIFQQTHKIKKQTVLSVCLYYLF